MPDYTRAEAAERAGLNEEELGRMIELGIIRAGEGDRISHGEIRKAALVHGMTEAGLPLEGLAAALTSGALTLSFMDSPAYDRFTALSDETFAQASQRTEVPVEMLMLAREAEGGALPSPDDRIRESELPTIDFIKLQLTEGFRPAAIERLLRVQGESLRRIAESESAWWRSEVIIPALAAGRGAEEMAQSELAERLSGVGEDSLMSLYRAHQTREWTMNIIDGFEATLTQAGYPGRVEKPPAMCFLDITGYTRLTQEEGDKAAADLAETLRRLVQRVSVQYTGRPVKWLGDGVMFYFREPGPGVIAALDMCEGVREAGLPPAHVGLHAGPVVFQEGDYYGQTVNIASRVAEYARPGEVLVTQAVAEASEGMPASFTDIGPVELKGVGGTVHLLAARRN